MSAYTRDRESSRGDGVPRCAPSTADVFNLLVREFELTLNSDGSCFATVQNEKGRTTYRLGSDGFRGWARLTCYERLRAIPREETLKDVEAVLRAKALKEGLRGQVWTRTGEANGRIYLDLGNDAGEVIEVSADGWTVLKLSPVLFWRPPLALPITRPPDGRDGTAAFDYVFRNLPESSRTLTKAWMLGSLFPKGSYPILELVGSPGSGKTTTAESISHIIDPSAAPLMGLPKDLREFAIVARNGWLVGLDNVTGLPPWAQDSLCRLATGEVSRARAKYTDDGESVIVVQRPVMLTAVQPVLGRSDLRDRSLPVYCTAITSDYRSTHEEVMGEVRTHAPSILGFLLNAVSASLRGASSPAPKRLPRLADFASRVIRAEGALELESGSFLRTLNSELRDSHQSELDTCPVGQAIVQLMRGRKEWTGTCTELLTELEDSGDRVRGVRGWPSGPAALSRRLGRIEPHLYAVGIEVRKGRSKSSERVRTLVLERVRPEGG